MVLDESMMNSSPLNVVARAERKTEMKTSIAKYDQLNSYGYRKISEQGKGSYLKRERVYCEELTDTLVVQWGDTGGNRP